MSNLGNQYRHMGKVSEAIKQLVENKYGYDFWYNKKGNNGVIIGEGGSRNSWNITVQMDNEDGQYLMDISINMKEIK